MIAVDRFNANLYVVTATVIPVLFLALTLQDRSWLELVLAAQRRQVEAIRFDRKDVGWRRLGDLAAGWVINWINAWVVAGAALGEMSSVLALDAGRATAIEHQSAVWSTIALVLITAGLQTWRQLSGQARMSREVAAEALKKRSEERAARRVAMAEALEADGRISAEEAAAMRDGSWTPEAWPRPELKGDATGDT